MSNTTLTYHYLEPGVGCVCEIVLLSDHSSPKTLEAHNMDRARALALVPRPTLHHAGSWPSEDQLALLLSETAISISYPFPFWLTLPEYGPHSLNKLYHLFKLC